MQQQLRIQFDTPAHGWLPITLATDDQQFTLTASHIPYTSLSNLVDSLITLMLTPNPAIVVWWNTEPIEYAFHLTAVENSAQIIVHEHHPRLRHEHRQPVFSYQTSRLQLVTAFWRGLRNLESRWPTSKQWNEDFPSRQLHRLAELRLSAEESDTAS